MPNCPHCDCSVDRLETATVPVGDRDRYADILCCPHNDCGKMLFLLKYPVRAPRPAAPEPEVIIGRS